MKGINISILLSQKYTKGLERSLSEVLAFVYEYLRLIP